MREDKVNQFKYKDVSMRGNMISMNSVVITRFFMFIKNNAVEGRKIIYVMNSARNQKNKKLEFRVMSVNYVTCFLEDTMFDHYSLNKMFGKMR